MAFLISTAASRCVWPRGLCASFTALCVILCLSLPVHAARKKKADADCSAAMAGNVATPNVASETLPEAEEEPETDGLRLELTGDAESPEDVAEELAAEPLTDEAYSGMQGRLQALILKDIENGSDRRKVTHYQRYLTLTFARAKILNREQEREVFERIRAFNRPSDRQKIMDSIPFLIPTFLRRSAKRRDKRIMEFVQQAGLGIAEAIERFNPDKGRFQTYAIHWVRRYVLDYIFRSARMVRLPMGDPYERIFWKLRNKMRWDAENNIDYEATAQAIGVNPDLLREMVHRMSPKREVSLEMPVQGIEKRSVGDTLTAAELNIGKALDENHKLREFRSRLQAWLEDLKSSGQDNPVTHAIIYERLLAEEPVHFKVLGDRFGGVSKQAMQDREKTIRKRLQAWMAPLVERYSDEDDEDFSLQDPSSF